MDLRFTRVTAVLCCLVALAVPARAQQTGSISGQVQDSGGGVLPGVTVEARSDVLPGPRVTTTGGAGEYQLPALPPGSYTVTFTLSGMQTVTRRAEVQLSQDVVADAELGVSGVAETVNVTADVSLIDKESASIKSSLTNAQILGLPVGQEYRDLIKLIPGVQYSQDAVRGPSAGGSGQDNVYQFDGVSVTLPLFGTLSAEPASHDIAQISIIKGGARAVDFERSGGFSIDSVSKSGTSQFAGQVSYQIQTVDMAAKLNTGVLSRYQQDRSWLDVNVGGPVFPNRLYFYGSYYRPEKSRNNQANFYGELPQYESTRNEGFGKVTFTPTNSVLLNFSYRDSRREDSGNSEAFLFNAAPTTGSGNETKLQIGTAEGSWVLGSRSHMTFKYTHFANDTLGRPDFISDAVINPAIGTRLDIVNLDRNGLLTVPSPLTGQTAFNAFAQPFIERYGYLRDGVRTGGGTAGYSSQFNDQDFFRDAGQIGYNLTFGTKVNHQLHVGYQQYVDSEELLRSSNGWGLVSIPGARTGAVVNGTPIFFTARYQAQSTGAAAPIVSEYRSKSFEINDTIRVKNWTFNVGLLASNDTLYGQGLREDSSTTSGFVSAPGQQYEMYDIPFSKMLQPRLSTTWAYNGKDTVYGSFARYNPAASSLPRAASWDRNLIGLFVDAHFDANGVLFATVPVGSSTGKLFVDDLTPRTIDEWLIGTAKQFTPQWSARIYGRYRKGSHFWEDTNNDARLIYNPPADIPRQLYVPDLAAKLAQIGTGGSGSSYVIAELDGAFTKYYEGTVETDWRSEKAFVRGSYTWSHYYGNFDQDNSSFANDDNIFIGSSNIADSGGRQLWNNKDGDLRGDRRHILKLYGYYAVPWRATFGAYAIAQSGQPWESWNYEVYLPFVGTSTNDTARYAEPAGSRVSPSHWQVDLNYTQNVPLSRRYNVQIVGDLFNVTDKQTGYNFEPRVHNSAFNTPRSYYDPRRFQLALRFQF